MSQAAWLASIPPAGVLTVDECPTFAAQALQEGDAQLAADILAGTGPNNAQLGSRADLLALFSLYGTAALAGPGTLVSVQCRNVLVNAGTNYFNVTGAP